VFFEIKWSNGVEILVINNENLSPQD